MAGQHTTESGELRWGRRSPTFAITRRARVLSRVVPVVLASRLDPVSAGRYPAEDNPSSERDLMVDIETTSLLLCMLADEQHALPMSDVREVIRWRVPTPIPGSPETILGVIHHRGMVLPILDVRTLLGFAAAPPTRNTRLLVVEQDGIQAALVSDAVVDIVEVEHAAVEPVPASLAASQARYLSGLFYWAGQPVALLTLATIFAAVTVSHAAG